MMKKKKPKFSAAVRREVIKRSRNRCERCGIDFDDDFKGEFHHIKPEVLGGKSTLENCSLLCKNCHHAAPNIKNEEDLLIYKHYFLRFASFKEAAIYYGVDNRISLYVELAKDIAKKYYK